MFVPLYNDEQPCPDVNNPSACYNIKQTMQNRPFVPSYNPRPGKTQEGQGQN